MNKEKNMSFWEHLDEFRNRLFIVLGSIFIGTLAGYSLSEKIIQVLTLPSENLNISFQVITVTSMFTIKLLICFFTGLLFGFPVLVYHLIKFILPAFEVKLSKLFLLVILSSLFFFSGILFGYYIIIPFLLTFFTSITFEGIKVEYNFTLGSYLNYTVWTMFINGIIFQMPIISYIGSKIVLLTPAFLRHYRRHSFIVFLVLSALITPPDPLSQILICIPFTALYELSIIVAKIFKK